MMYVAGHMSVCTRMVGLGNVVMVIIYMKDINYSTEVKNALTKRKQAQTGSNIQNSNIVLDMAM